MNVLVAVAIGIAFGWALERAGLGSARKLAGQFYGTDFTVFKVMFTAILVAMLGAFWLGRLGAIDLAQVFVPETWLAPQLAGGLIFGAGFLVAGLCPGTSCVDAATERWSSRGCSPACSSQALRSRLFARSTRAPRADR
jgi:uncharacterized membrane protein YedE/YeeE